MDDADAIFLLAPEAERLIEALQPFPLDKVGTEEWLLQHEVIEKLNMQAHQCARSGSEDFILEARSRMTNCQSSSTSWSSLRHGGKMFTP